MESLTSLIFGDRVADNFKALANDDESIEEEITELEKRIAALRKRGKRSGSRSKDNLTELIMKEVGAL